MDFARLETDCLAHIDERYFYGAFCRKCKHRARLSLVRLRERLGDNFRLADIRERLICERCSSRLIVVTFLAPDQQTPNVVILFDQTARD